MPTSAFAGGGTGTSHAVYRKAAGPTGPAAPAMIQVVEPAKRDGQGKKAGAKGPSPDAKDIAAATNALNAPVKDAGGGSIGASLHPAT
jgi:hypothetical protein